MERLRSDGRAHDHRASEASNVEQASRFLCSPPGIPRLPMSGNEPQAGASLTLALAGDTMLGRSVEQLLRTAPDAELLAPEVIAIAAEADLFVLNLECCIADVGVRNAASHSPYFFRAPPVAATHLARWGVDVVTLANNHVLDYGIDACMATFEHLDAAGIRFVGAGPDLASARETCSVRVGDRSIAFIAFSDHPAAYAAGTDRSGVAYAPASQTKLAAWVEDSVRAARRSHDLVVVLPHWGPNMVASPVREVRAAARALVDAGADLVAGHSSHVVHGVEGRVLFSLGDFIDDYASDELLRNDLSLLFLVRIGARGVERIEAVPLKLEYCRTRLADGADADSISQAFAERCRRLGTEVRHEPGRIVVDLAPTLDLEFRS